MDYLLGVILIGAPWVLGSPAVSHAESWGPIILGEAVILYSLLTDYEVALVPVIPIPMHLSLDGAVGLSLVACPWLLGFTSVLGTLLPIFGICLMGIALITSRTAGHRALAA
jgi:hypothetical protein